MEKTTWMLTSCNIVLFLVLISIKLNTLIETKNEPRPTAEGTSTNMYLKTPNFGSDDSVEFFAQNAGIEPSYFSYQKKIVGIK